MERFIATLGSGERVIFDRGSFDDWCVFLVKTDGSRIAPRDISYFSDLQKLTPKYSGEKIYDDFLEVYDLTNAAVEESVLALIKRLSKTYKDEDSGVVERSFTLIYAGMIAEENKERAILKKRIKRLGMHQILLKNLDVSEAATFSKGKSWKELNALMNALDF